jgi:hypothetical protein
LERVVSQKSELVQHKLRRGIARLRQSQKIGLELLSLYDGLGEALEQVTAQDIIGWFQDAGLCATHA